MRTTKRVIVHHRLFVLAAGIVSVFLIEPRALAAEDGFAPVCPGAEGKRAFDDLAEFYAGKRKIDYSKELVDQTSSDPKVASSATSYLLALLKQSRADEVNGRSKAVRAPFVHTPFVMFSQYFRKSLEDQIIKSAKGPSSFELADWMILEENRADAMELLKRSDAPEVSSTLEKLLKRPYSQKGITVDAIDLIGIKQFKTLAPLVVPYGNHYRASVRAAAEKTCNVLGVKAAPYNAQTAMTPWIKGELHTVSQMLFPIPPSSQFGIYDEKWEHGESYIVSEGPGLPQLKDNSKKPPQERTNLKTHTGWKLSSNKDSIDILDSNGNFVVLSAAATKFTPITVKDETLRIVSAIKQKKFPWRIVSSYNAWQGEQQPIVLGAYLSEAGDSATAAEILFPFIDTLEDDRMISGKAREFLSESNGNQMLREFQNRNYKQAALIAQQLAKPVFKGCYFHQIGVDLTDQLRTRSGDFKTFKLPTPAEWTAMKKSMPRESQIKFLADHLRLLNCHQTSNPGSPNFHTDQFSLKAGPDWPEGTCGVKLINPYNELLSTVQTANDVQILIPYLKDKSFILSVQEGRFSSPSYPYRVKTIAALAINWAAGKDVVDFRKSGSTEDKIIEETMKWAKTPSLTLKPKPYVPNPYSF